MFIVISILELLKNILDKQFPVSRSGIESKKKEIERGLEGRGKNKVGREDSRDGRMFEMDFTLVFRKLAELSKYSQDFSRKKDSFPPGSLT